MTSQFYLQCYTKRKNTLVAKHTDVLSEKQGNKFLKNNCTICSAKQEFLVICAGYRSSAKHCGHPERFPVYSTFSMKMVFNSADLFLVKDEAPGRNLIKLIFQDHCNLYSIFYLSANVDLCACLNDPRCKTRDLPGGIFYPFNHCTHVCVGSAGTWTRTTRCTWLRRTATPTPWWPSSPSTPIS